MFFFFARGTSSLPLPCCFFFFFFLPERGSVIARPSSDATVHLVGCVGAASRFSVEREAADVISRERLSTASRQNLKLRQCDPMPVNEKQKKKTPAPADSFSSPPPSPSPVPHLSPARHGLPFVRPSVPLSLFSRSVHYYVGKFNDIIRLTNNPPLSRSRGRARLYFRSASFIPYLSRI